MVNATPSTVANGNDIRRKKSGRFDMPVLPANAARQVAAVRSRTKKADVAEHPQVFHHVGLLSNEPPGTAGLLSI